MNRWHRSLLLGSFLSMLGSCGGIEPDDESADVAGSQLRAVNVDFCDTATFRDRLNVGESRTYTLSSCSGPAWAFSAWVQLRNCNTYIINGVIGRGPSIAGEFTVPESYPWAPSATFSMGEAGRGSDGCGLGGFASHYSVETGYVGVDGTWTVEIHNTGDRAADLEVGMGVAQGDPPGA